MNIEKVLDLAVQADPTTVQVLGEIGGRAFIAANGIRPQYIQKFAELIVAEATDVVYKMLDDNTGAEVVVAVKEHFGVEQ